MQQTCNDYMYCTSYTKYCLLKLFFFDLSNLISQFGTKIYFVIQGGVHFGPAQFLKKNGTTKISQIILYDLELLSEQSRLM